MEAKTNKDLVPNHTARYRQIRLNEDFTITDIFSIRRSVRIDNPDYTTSFHMSDEGRYQLRFKRDVGVITILDLVTQQFIVGPLYRQIIDNLNPILLEWLKDANKQRYANIVPNGFGWDGVFSRSEYNKLAKLNKILSPWWDGQVLADQDELNANIHGLCLTTKKFLDFVPRPFPHNRRMIQDLRYGSHHTLYYISKEGHLCKGKYLPVQIGNNFSYEFDIPDGCMRVIRLIHDVQFVAAENKYRGIGLEVYG